MECKKDHSILNTAVQPSGDLLSSDFKSSLPVYAYTVKYDSIAAADDDYKYLGSNQDPVFGRMDIGLYLNSSMNLTYLNFGSEARLTSSEIILAKAIDSTSFMGNINAQLTYSVFVLDSLLDPTRIYYSNNTSLHNQKSLIGSCLGKLSLYNGQTVLRIPINNDYARAIFNNPQYLVNNTVFQSIYKGFYITSSGSSLSSSGNQGVVFKCDLSNDVSGFYLRYQTGSPSAIKDEQSFKFSFTGVTSVRFNTAKFDFTNGGNTNLIQQVVQGDTAAGSQNLFLKGMGATKLKVYIPSLKSYVDSAFTLAINRAEVVFKLDQDPNFENNIQETSSRYIVPPRLLLLPMDSAGRETYAPDQSNSYRYDGNYDVANKRYVFNIATFAQQVIKGQIKNYGFYLVVANTDVIYGSVYDGDTSKELLTVRRDNYMERVILAGSGSSLKPEFNLSYIKLKKN